MINDLTLLLPEFILAGVAFLVLAVDLLLHPSRKHLLPYLSIAGMTGVLAFSLVFLWNQDSTLYEGLIIVDHFSLFFKAFFLVLGIFVVLSSVDFVRAHLSYPGEYYGILLFSVLAMMLMATSGELLTAYISLELLSFGLYVLVAYNRLNPKSNEAGTKYILLGAFSSAILLYGISIIYGTLGTTRFDGISTELSSMSANGVDNPLLMVGLVLIIAGLGFKIAAVPFHMWAPDVYEGAPTPITGYLAVGAKAAGFALILRFFSEGLMPIVEDWLIIIAILAAFTMTIGNLLALTQHNIKRLLGYSSIGQVGYLLLGVASLGKLDGETIVFSELASNGIMFHLAGYAVTNLAAFLCVIAFFNATGKENVHDFSGLAKRSPFLAMVFTVSLFSLAGLPIFAGFTTKFYLFTAAATQNLLWLAGLAIVNSVISLYYYLVVIRQIYIQPVQANSPIRVPVLTQGTLVILFLGIIIIGIYPEPLLKTIQSATHAIMP